MLCNMISMTRCAQNLFLLQGSSNGLLYNDPLTCQITCHLSTGWFLVYCKLKHSCYCTKVMIMYQGLNSSHNSSSCVLMLCVSVVWLCFVHGWLVHQWSDNLDYWKSRATEARHEHMSQVTHKWVFTLIHVKYSGTVNPLRNLVRVKHCS